MTSFALDGRLPAPRPTCNTAHDDRFNASPMHQALDVDDDLVLVAHWTKGLDRLEALQLLPLGVAKLLRCVLADAENTRVLEPFRRCRKCGARDDAFGCYDTCTFNGPLHDWAPRELSSRTLRPRGVWELPILMYPTPSDLRDPRIVR